MPRRQAARPSSEPRQSFDEHDAFAGGRRRRHGIGRLPGSVARGRSSIDRHGLSSRSSDPIDHPAMTIDAAIDVTGAATTTPSGTGEARPPLHVGMALACAAAVFSGFAKPFDSEVAGLASAGASRDRARHRHDVLGSALPGADHPCGDRRIRLIEGWYPPAPRSPCSSSCQVCRSRRPEPGEDIRRRLDRVSLCHPRGPASFSVSRPPRFSMRRRKRLKGLHAAGDGKPAASSHQPLAYRRDDPVLIPAVALAFVAAIVVRDRLVLNRFHAVSAWGGWRLQNLFRCVCRLALGRGMPSRAAWSIGPAAGGRAEVKPRARQRAGARLHNRRRLRLLPTRHFRVGERTCTRRQAQARALAATPERRRSACDGVVNRSVGTGRRAVGQTNIFFATVTP